MKIVKPWPKFLSPKPKTKTKGPWADTKIFRANTPNLLEGLGGSIQTTAFP